MKYFDIGDIPEEHPGKSVSSTKIYYAYMAYHKATFLFVGLPVRCPTTRFFWKTEEKLEMAIYHKHFSFPWFFYSKKTETN
jgi:hypothetical protein